MALLKGWMNRIKNKDQMMKNYEIAKAKNPTEAVDVLKLPKELEGVNLKDVNGFDFAKFMEEK